MPDDKNDVEDEFPTEQNFEMREALRALEESTEHSDRKPTKAEIAEAIKKFRKKK